MGPFMMDFLKHGLKYNHILVLSFYADIYVILTRYNLLILLAVTNQSVSGLLSTSPSASREPAFVKHVERDTKESVV